MGNSHVAAWGPNPPTPAQLKEFFAQVESGQLTHSRLQGLLRSDDLKGSKLKAEIRLVVYWNREHVFGHAGRTVGTLRVKADYDTVKLMIGDKVIYSQTFCNNRERLYSFCSGVITAMRLAGHSIEIPNGLQSSTWETDKS